MTFSLKTKVFFSTVVFLATLCAVSAGLSMKAEWEARDQRRLVVKNLGLTDLALWFEAMHTRHPSQADMFAPFGDYPGALEHFPSGSLAPPLRERSSFLATQKDVDQ